MTESDRISVEYRTTTVLVLTLDVIGSARRYILYWESNIVHEINIVLVSGYMSGLVVIDGRQTCHLLIIVCRVQYQPRMKHQSINQMPQHAQR